MFISNRQKALFLIFGCSFIFFMILFFQPRNRAVNPGSQSTVAQPTPLNSPTLPSANTFLQNVNISDGSQIFYDHADKEVQYFKKSGQFKKARDIAVKKQGDFCADPELLIYKNNQEILGNNSYTIAVAVPIGSDNKGLNNAALELLRGVAQAQDEINKNPKKINGKFLKVVIASDRDSKATEPIAKALVNNYKTVLGVVGHHRSNATMEAMKVYNDKLVLISPSSSSTKINQNENNQYFFRTVPNTMAGADILSKYMVNKLGFTKATIVWNPENDIYSESLKDEFKDKLIKDLKVQDTPIEIAKDNFNTEFIKKSPTDRAFVLTVNVDSISDTSNTIRSEEIKREAQQFYYLAGDAVYGKNMLEKRFRNMVIAVAWHQSDESTESQEFVKKGKELWCQKEKTEDKERITWRTATAYDATYLFIEALKETSGNNSQPTRERIQQYLQEYKQQRPPFQGVTGKISFENNGDVKNKAKLVRVCEKKERTGTKYVYKLEDLDNPNLNVNQCDFNS